jgi:hypothetical protein
MQKVIFKIRIDQLQPSQPYLSQPRLDNILRITDFLLRPLGVREMSGRYCIIEGHERCFALDSLGRTEVDVYVDSGSKDAEIWKECVDITMHEGVAVIHDLGSRILPGNLFRQLWLARKKELASGRLAGA